MSDDWLTVWLQGGEADDWRYQTMVEPDEEILMLRDPFKEDEWIHVVGPWPQAIPYVRQPSVEQFDHERIYYPKETT